MNIQLTQTGITERTRFVLRALKHSSRLELVLIIRNCSFCVINEIIKQTSLQRSTIQKQLKILVQAGLIGYHMISSKDARSYRRPQYSYYTTPYCDLWIHFLMEKDVTEAENVRLHTDVKNLKTINDSLRRGWDDCLAILAESVGSMKMVVKEEEQEEGHCPEHGTRMKYDEEGDFWYCPIKSCNQTYGQPS